MNKKEQKMRGEAREDIIEAFKLTKKQTPKY